MDKKIIDQLKHIHTFYEQAPPGMVKEQEEQPEDCIPETEQNREAREFLANAPKKGLWMPLGKEVKVMQCWRCKNYGHRTGDRECPFFMSGNAASEKFREQFEDPMHTLIKNKTKKNAESANKLKWLNDILTKSSTSSSEDEVASKKKKRKKKKSKKEKKKKDKVVWVEKEVKSKKLKRKRKSSTSDSSDEEKARKKIKKHKNKSKKH